MAIAAYLLDIEGTTTPIDFVHKILFPFAKERIEPFVSGNFEALEGEIKQLAAERAADTKYSSYFHPNSAPSVAEYLRFLIDVDRKSTPLKSIQGKIWQAGYESGELRSQIFDDVLPAFERWKTADKTIAIYSSGSVLAQKNLFKYTDHGDLTPFISDYFDTNVGGKKEVESYRKIAEALEFEANVVLFVSDVPEELEAARSSGLQTALSIREGNAPIDEDFTHQAVQTFDELPN